MKNQYTPAQLATIKTLTPWEFTSLHGNTKKVKGLPIAEFKAIVNKKRERLIARERPTRPNLYKELRELAQHSKKAKGTPYFKTLIEGFTGIYYASPSYGHRDYNKTRIMDKTPHNVKLMEVFNKLVTK